MLVNLYRLKALPDKRKQILFAFFVAKVIMRVNLATNNAHEKSFKTGNN